MTENEKKFYCYGAMWSTAVLFTSGSILQTFFIETGLSSQQIAEHASMVNIAQMIAMCIGLNWADRVRNVRGGICLLMLCPILFAVPMLPFCFEKNPDSLSIYYVAMICGCITNLFIGFYNLLANRLPHLIIDMKWYARLANNSNIMNSIFSIAVAGAIALFSVAISYRLIMMFGFILTIVCCISCALLVSQMVITLPPGSSAKQEGNNKYSVSLTKKVKEKEFRFFLLPTLLRGVAGGGISIIAVICAAEITTNPAVISGLATISTIAMIIGCSLYKAVSLKLKTAKVYLDASVLMLLFMSAMLLRKTVPFFCICYFGASIGFGILGTAGAVYAMEIVGYRDIGTYTGFRYIIISLGQALSTYVIVWAMNYIPTAVIMAICGVFQLLSGILYYYYDVSFVQETG